jgi:Saf4/Yju2 protein
MEGIQSKFLTPYTLQCSNCQSIIPKGTKVIAYKRNCIIYIVGNYLDVNVHEINFECNECRSCVVLKTNPEFCRYDIVAGCSRYVIVY